MTKILSYMLSGHDFEWTKYYYQVKCECERCFQTLHQESVKWLGDFGYMVLLGEIN